METVLLLRVVVVVAFHSRQEAMLVHQRQAQMVHQLYLPDMTRQAVKVQLNLLGVQVDCEVRAALALLVLRVQSGKVEPLVQRVVAAVEAVTTAVVVAPWNVTPAQVAVDQVGLILFQSVTPRTHLPPTQRLQDV